MSTPLGRHPVIIQEASGPILAQAAYTSSHQLTPVENHPQVGTLHREGDSKANEKRDP